jgi:hypothetical protein
MIKVIIDILQTNEFYGISENVDIAKGKYATPYNLKTLGKHIKRRLWPKRK